MRGLFLFLSLFQLKFKKKLNNKLIAIKDACPSYKKPSTHFWVVLNQQARPHWGLPSHMAACLTSMSFLSFYSVSHQSLPSPSTHINCFPGPRGTGICTMLSSLRTQLSSQTNNYSSNIFPPSLNTDSQDNMDGGAGGTLQEDLLALV